MPDKQNKLSILMLCPLRYVASIAFVMESIVAFADRGHMMHVLVSDDADPPFDYDHPMVRIHTFRDAKAWRGMQNLHLARKAWQCARAHHYDCVIGLSQVGLIVAAMLKRHFGMPCISYNDEIYFGNERKTFLGDLYGHTLKWFERQANVHADLTVTQDPKRGRMLAEVNRIPTESLRYLPNARSGPAQIVSSHYLQTKFNLASTDSVILWLGGAISYDLVLRMAKQAGTWPNTLKLLFHFRRGDVPKEVKQQLFHSGQGNTFISENPVSYEQTVAVATSARIGLCLYLPSGPNVTQIWNSSGKINLFLQNGIPCVVQDMEGLRWVEGSGAGICISQVEQVLPAVQQILANYPSYQNAALNVFEEQLSFDRASRPLFNEIETLCDKESTI